jgi:hypothetical protein
MSQGREVIAVLLERGVDSFVISEGLVAEMTRFFDQEAMALLLNRWGHEMTITEEVVKAAAGNRSHGREVMAVLLE